MASLTVRFTLGAAVGLAGGMDSSGPKRRLADRSGAAE
jgi:hypothetical protein